MEGQEYHSIHNNLRSRRQISRSAEVTHILSSLLKKECHEHYLSKGKRVVLFSGSRLPDNYCFKTLLHVSAYNYILSRKKSLPYLERSVVKAYFCMGL